MSDQCGWIQGDGTLCKSERAAYAKHGCAKHAPAVWVPGIDECTDTEKVACLEAQLALARAVGDAWKAYAQAEVAIRRADYDAIGSAAFQLEGEAVSAVLALKALGIDPEAP